VPEATRPSDEVVKALGTALGHNFGTCDCWRTASHSHMCDGHAFLHERPRLAERWQLLLFYRSQAPRLLREEGFVLETPTPEASGRGTLWW